MMVFTNEDFFFSNKHEIEIRHFEKGRGKSNIEQLRKKDFNKTESQIKLLVKHLLT